jgi:transporter family-2 protein
MLIVALLIVGGLMPAIWGYLLALGAGVSFVFQQAVNSNLREEVGSPWWAGFISYAGGTLSMLLVALILREPLPAPERFNWFSWTGGIFGAVYIAVSIILLPRLGAATVIALLVAGQMVGSLAFDHFGFLVPLHQLTMPRLLGAGFLVAGVTLIRW